MSLIHELVKCCSPAGFEERLANVIIESMPDIELHFDGLGNLIFRRPGDGKRLLFTAPMDECGVIATFIEPNGYIRISPVGKIDPAAVLHQKLKFANGVSGVMCLEHTDDKQPSFSKMYVDTGASSAEDCGVTIGSPAVFAPEVTEMNGCLCAKAIAGRAACFALTELAKHIQSNDSCSLDIYFAFTTQSKLRHRGAKTVAFSIMPDFCVSLSSVPSGDIPEQKGNPLKIGSGATILIKDGSMVASRRIQNILTIAAQNANAPFQLYVGAESTTDAAAVETFGAGTISGAIMLPTRYQNTAVEMISEKDLNALMKIIKEVPMVIQND